MLKKKFFDKMIKMVDDELSKVESNIRKNVRYINDVSGQQMILKRQRAELIGLINSFKKKGQ